MDRKPPAWETGLGPMGDAGVGDSSPTGVPTDALAAALVLGEHSGV